MTIKSKYVWGFLAVVGILLMIVGLMGRPGSFLAVAFAPDQIQVVPGAS